MLIQILETLRFIGMMQKIGQNTEAEIHLKCLILQSTRLNSRLLHSINLNGRHVNGITHFDLAVQSAILRKTVLQTFFFFSVKILEFLRQEECFVASCSSFVCYSVFDMKSYERHRLFATPSHSTLLREAASILNRIDSLILSHTNFTFIKNHVPLKKLWTLLEFRHFYFDLT